MRYLRSDRRSRRRWIEEVEIANVMRAFSVLEGSE